MRFNPYGILNEGSEEFVEPFIKEIVNLLNQDKIKSFLLRWLIVIMCHNSKGQDD